MQLKIWLSLLFSSQTNLKETMEIHSDLRYYVSKQPVHPGGDCYAKEAISREQTEVTKHGYELHSLAIPCTYLIQSEQSTTMETEKYPDLAEWWVIAYARLSSEFLSATDVGHGIWQILAPIIPIFGTSQRGKNGAWSTVSRCTCIW
jgi:hypothetical protein